MIEYNYQDVWLCGFRLGMRNQQGNEILWVVSCTEDTNVSMLKRHPLLTSSIVVAFEAVCFVIAYVFTVWVTRPVGVRAFNHATSGLLFFFAGLALWYVIAFRHRLYLARRGELLLSQLVITSRVLFIWMIVSIFFYSLTVSDRMDRKALLIFLFSSMVLMLFGRSFLRLSAWGIRRRGYNTRRIIIVGISHCSDHLIRTIQANEQFGWHVEGFLDDATADRRLLERCGIPYLGSIADLEGLLVDRVIDSVFVNLPLRSSYETVERIVGLCEGVGVSVRMVADLFALGIGCTDVRRVADLPVISLVSRPGVQFRAAMKRLSEWLIALGLLMLIAPVLLAISIAIRATSSGPIIVRKYCISPDRCPIATYVFRTTVSGHGESAAHFTSVGSFLHQYGLDELPQLFNVLRGEIAMIGAHPLKPSIEYPCVGCPGCWPPEMIESVEGQGDRATQPQCPTVSPMAARTQLEGAE